MVSRKFLATITLLGVIVAQAQFFSSTAVFPPLVPKVEATGGCCGGGLKLPKINLPKLPKIGGGCKSNCGGGIKLPKIHIPKLPHIPIPNIPNPCKHGNCNPNPPCTHNCNPQPPVCKDTVKTLYTKDEDGILNFVNSKTGANLPKHSALRMDEATADKVCQLAGYDGAEDYDCKSKYDGGRCGFHSCGDNKLSYWNGVKFVTGNACDLGNKWLTTLSCYKGNTCPSPTPQCKDGIDNDGDGKIDYPQDPGCSSPTDDSESPDPTPTQPQCSDGIDNDGDGKIDYPQDEGCSSPNDDTEYTPSSCQARNLLQNPGFEQTVNRNGLPTDDGFWSGSDKGQNSGAAQGITPLAGSKMWNYLEAGNDKAVWVQSDLWQLVDVSHLPAGTVLNIEGFFNRVAGDAQTDTDFKVIVKAYNFPMSQFPSRNEDSIAAVTARVTTDGNVKTWQKASNTLTLPAGTTFIGVDATPIENVFNDAVSPEFDGHFGDEICIEPVSQPTPPTGDGACPLPVRALKDVINGLTVTEETTQLFDHTFAINDPDLLNQGTTDFTTGAHENYDVYISDATGQRNPNGSYLTIRNYRNTNYTDGAVGNNIDAVELDLKTGAIDYADRVVRVELGTGLSSSYIAQRGKANLALGQSDAQSTKIGDQHSSLTLGFCDALKEDEGANLSITKSGPNSVVRGNTITYTVNVTNAGPETATNVTVADVIPSGFTFNQAQSSSNCVLNAGGTSVLCNNFSLTAGQSRSLSIAFNVPNVNQCSSSAVVNNTATVSSSSTDPVSSNNTSNTVSTVVNCPTSNEVDLNITKSGPSSVTAGSVVSYTIAVSNAGPATANNVTIGDVIPTGVTFNAGQSSSNCVLNTGGTSVLCNNFSLTAGQSRTFTISFNVPLPAGQCNSGIVIHNQATVSSSSPDSNNSNNISNTVNTTINCPTPTDEANLSIIKSGPNSVIRGNTVSYTVTVSNAGPATANNVTVADVIPAGMTFNAAGSPGCVLNGAGTSVLCNNFNLLNGQSRTFTIMFNVPTINQCATTSIQNVATVSSSTSDPVNSNNTSNVVTTTVNCPTVQPQCSDLIDNDGDGLIDHPNDPGCDSPSDDDETNTVSSANLSITKTGVSSAPRGSNITYPVTVTNAGPSVATNVVIADPVPAGLTFVDAQSSTECNLVGNNVICDGFNLAIGQSRTFNLVFSIPAAGAQCTPTSVSNVATVTSSTSDPQSSNNTSNSVSTLLTCPTVDEDAYLSITKTGPASAVRGNTISYTVSATNAGPATANNVVIADVIPAGLVFNAAGSPGCVLNGGGTSVLCNNFNLTVGQTRTFTIMFNIPTINQCVTSTIQNTATVSALNVKVGSQTTSNTVATTVTCGTPVPQCSDGLDNDNDGKIDHPTDPGCDNPNDNDETDTATDAFLSISKSGPASVTRGNTINYTVTVTNSGPATANNVVISDVIPSGFTFNAAGSAGCVLNGGGTSVLCNNFNLTAGQSRTFTISFNVPTINQCSTTTAQNVATVSALNVMAGSQTTSNVVSSTVNCPTVQPQCSDLIDNDGDGLIDHPNDPGCSSPTDNDETNTVDNDALLSITKTGPASVTRGNTLNYTVSVTNSGPAAANNVVISDVIPAGLTFNAAGSNGCVLNGAGTSVLCNNFNLAVGQTRTFNIAFNVPTISQCTTTSVQNIATVSASNVKAGSQTTSSTVNTTVNCGTSVPQCSDGLDNDNDGKIDFGTDPGCENANDNDETDTVANTANLSITKSGASSIVRGNTLQYTVTVSNAGPATAQNVVIADPVPTGLTFNPAQSSGECSLIGSNVICQNFNLTSGQTRSFTIGFTVPTISQCQSTVSVFNTATVTSSTADPQTSNNTSNTVNTSVTCQAGSNNVTIDLRDSIDPVEPDQTYSYFVILTNLSSSDVSGLTVVQTLDNDTDFISASDGGVANSPVTWTNISIPANGTKTLTVNVRVDSSADDGDVLNSTATVSGNGVNASDSENTLVDEDGDDDDDDCDDIRMTITDDRDPVEIGEEVEYSIRIDNNCSSSVTLDVNGFLDEDTEFIDASNGGDDISDDEVEWENITISRNSSTTLRVRVEVLNSADEGEQLRFEAQTEDEEDTELTLVGDDFGNPDSPLVISVDKSADRSEAQPGSIVSYQVNIFNPSNYSVSVTVDDVFSSGVLSIEDAAGGQITSSGIRWSNMNIAAGSTRTLVYTIRIDESMRHGEVIFNNVRVEARDGNSTRVATDSAEVRIIEDLPQTGFSNVFGKSLNGTAHSLKPHQSESSTGSDVGLLTMWITIISAGLGLGTMAGKKFLFL